MKIILHGGPADGHDYYVPDQMRQFEVVEDLEPFWPPCLEPPALKTKTFVYQRTDQTDEEGRTVFSI